MRGTGLGKRYHVHSENLPERELIEIYDLIPATEAKRRKRKEAKEGRRLSLGLERGRASQAELGCTFCYKGRGPGRPGPSRPCAGGSWPLRDTQSAGQAMWREEEGPESGRTQGRPAGDSSHGRREAQFCPRGSDSARLSHTSDFSE